MIDRRREGAQPSEERGCCAADPPDTQRDVPSVSQHWAADDLVHSTIANATGNRCLEKMIRDLRCRTRIFNTHRIPSRLHPGALEHLAIMKAIAAGDRDKSRALIGSAKSAIINELTASGNAA
jgi:DNA-binding GntR family transcriptional regulator